MIERIIVWYCTKHGPVAQVHDRKEVARHRAGFGCDLIYDKRVYAHVMEWDKWYDLTDHLFANNDESIAFLRMSEDEQRQWIENVKVVRGI